MKLVGTYRAVVVSAESMDKDGKDYIKVTFDATDELINGQWLKLPSNQKVSKTYFLNENVGKSGKSAAQITAEQFKDSYDFVGTFDEIAKIVFSEVHIVCVDHNRGNFTDVKYVNNPNKKVPEIKPIASDKLARLNAIFGAVTK